MNIMCFEIFVDEWLCWIWTQAETGSLLGSDARIWTQHIHWKVQSLCFIYTHLQAYKTHLKHMGQKCGTPLIGTRAQEGPTFFVRPCRSHSQFHKKVMNYLLLMILYNNSDLQVYKSPWIVICLMVTGPLVVVLWLVVYPEANTQP